MIGTFHWLGNAPCKYHCGPFWPRVRRNPDLDTGGIANGKKSPAPKKRRPKSGWRTPDCGTVGGGTRASAAMGKACVSMVVADSRRASPGWHLPHCQDIWSLQP